MSAPPKEYLTVKEIAAMTEMTERTIRRWCASGAIPAVPCPGGRGYRVPVSALRERADLVGHAAGRRRAEAEAGASGRGGGEEDD